MWLSLGSRIGNLVSRLSRALASRPLHRRMFSLSVYTPSCFVTLARGSIVLCVSRIHAFRAFLISSADKLLGAVSSLGLSCLEYADELQYKGCYSEQPRAVAVPLTVDDSVSVNGGGYLPRRSGSINIHRYSPPLRRIIVNCHLIHPTGSFVGFSNAIMTRALQIATQHTRGWSESRDLYCRFDCIKLCTGFSIARATPIFREYEAWNDYTLVLGVFIQLRFRRDPPVPP